MLTQLTINNFAIVDNLLIDFNSGMTAITGETGAGKSIAIDALGLCLGARSDISLIKHGSARLDISAHFVLDDTPSALNWLTENQLNDNNECILRRVVSQDGRSKAFINGRAVPIAQLKELGQMLIQIHGQHEHQLLLRADYQQTLLDQYMADNHLLSAMKLAYKKWKVETEKYTQYLKSRQENDAHIQLLQYQLKELNEFSPIEGEYQQIDEEHKRLANSEQLINLSHNLIDLIQENQDINLLNHLSNANRIAQDLASLDGQLIEISTMLDEAAIQIREASYEIHRYIDNLEIDPSRIMQLEQRLSKQISLARKHHISPEKLPELHQQLLDEFNQISNQDEIGEQLKQNIAQYQQEALSCAKALHDKRVKIAAILSQKITHSIRELAIPHGEFSIDIVDDSSKISETGIDQITFLVSTNPGQPMQPISKVASGGELSRIALTIQVLTAQKMETPALIFDEIDVGISGPTAAKVGNLLRQLGLSTQVITVTHLPQVAGNAHHHYFVAKQTDGKHTETNINILTQSQRLKELARLLGGDKITENTLANAKELLIQ
ncbi:DNA repair protein RecN [Orbus mooreae]|uniref:DNA repair protein RecN n=1 Tax=Orbus mooreae TaxID=3074107 RepID=UPI00370D6ADC